MGDDAHEVSQPFDLGAARETLRLLQLAHDRWREINARLEDEKFEGENTREEVSLRVRGPAVETIVWARALDDWCLGLPENKVPTQAVLPGYEERRVEVEGLLSGARYATNKSLHQLLALMEPRGMMKFPVNVNDIFGTFRDIRWTPEGRLPPLSSETRGRKVRESYVAHLAGNAVGPTLDRLREFFEAVLAAADT